MKGGKKMITRVYNIIRSMLVLACTVVGFVACDSDVHDEEHGVSFALTWQDPDDSGTAINDIRLWIYKQDGSLVGEYHYTSTKELSLQCYKLAAGDYVAVVGANLVSPFSAESTSSYETITYALDSSLATSSGAAHSYYATATFNYAGTGTKTVTADIARTQSELTVIVEGAPEGATLATTVTNATTGVMPAVKDDENRYGTALSGTAVNISLPTATTASGTMTTFMRLMPTNNGNTTSILHFVVTLADGTVQHFDGEAPKMRPSGKYILTLKYSEMRAYMYITVYTINDWTEGWTIGGSILNPDE